MLKRLRILLFINVIIVLFASNWSSDQVLIPIIDFFKTAEQSTFRISPDGKYISYLKPYRDKQNLFIRSLADGRERMATSFSDYPVGRDYFWAFNNEIVFNQDIIALDEYKMFTVDASTLKVHQIFSQEKVRITLLNRNKE